MTDEELIAELRKPWFTNGCERYQLDAADRIEALVKERDQWIEHTKNAVWADSEELKLANDRIKGLEAAGRAYREATRHFKPCPETSANFDAALKGGETMTDKELIAWVRDGFGNAAADRIEALVKRLDTVKDKAEAHIIDLMAERDRAEARAERMEAALREIESISVHSGGEVHGVTALQWELAFAHAQDIASAALK